MLLIRRPKGRLRRIESPLRVGKRPVPTRPIPAGRSNQKADIQRHD